MASEKKGEGKANCTQVAPLCSTVSCTQGLSPPDLGKRLFINDNKLEPIRDTILDRGEKQLINTTGEVYKPEPIRDIEKTGGAGNWAHIIVGSVATLLGVLLVVPRNITVNIVNGHGHNLPMTASIEGRNKFAISFFNFNGNVN